MSDQMPTGWMSADEARKWARSGGWVYVQGDGVVGTWDADDADDLISAIEPDDRWRYVGHPDDEPAEPVGMVEIEAWVVVSEDGHSYATRTRDAADSLAAGFIQATKVVRLTGYTTPPTPEAVETVRGVAS